MIAFIKFKPYLNSLLTNSPQNKVLEENYVSSFANLKLQVQVPKSPQTEGQEQLEAREQYLVLEGLRKYASERILLSGKPGSGKSTALRELQRQEAKRCLKAIEGDEDEIPSIPILIELRSLRSSILASIKAKLGWWIELDDQIIKKLIRDRQLLILLDGLNELPDNSKLQEVEEFRKLCGEFQTPLIITTRELGSALTQGDIKKLEMLPLTEPQMREFINQRLPETGEKLRSQLQGKLKELGQTPLLLQMLCEVFSDRGEIPQNRGELFRKEFARRYDKFKPERLRNVTDDSRRFAFNLLCHLASTMIQGDPHVDPCKPTASWITISRTKAEEILEQYLSSKYDLKAKAKEWLEDLLEWHLLQISSDRDRLEFHHQLFQEYYAGEYLALQLDKLSDEELQQNYLNYLKWTEPMAIAMSFVESETLAVRMTKLALDVDLKLGAEIAGSFTSDVQAKTVVMISELQIPDRLKVYLLGETKSPIIADVLLKFLEDQDAETRKVAVWAARKLSFSHAIPVINKALQDSEFQVRDTAIRAVAEIDIEQAVSYTVELLSNELEASICQTIIICILSESQSDLAIRQLIKLTNDKNYGIRDWAFSALKSRNRSKVVSLLASSLKDKSNELSSRICAAKQLGELGDESVISDLNEIILCENASSTLWGTASMSYAEIISRLGGDSKAEKEPQEKQQEQVIDRWLEYLDSEKSIERINAVRHLTGMSGKNLLPKNEAIDLARRYLEDSHYEVRGHAISALVTLIKKEAIPDIIKTLNNPNYELISYEASQALTWLKESLPTNFELPARTIVKLIERLNEGNEIHIRLNTAETIENLCRISSTLSMNQDLENALFNTSFSPNKYLCAFVVNALGYFTSDRVVERLLNLLEDPEHYVSLCATQAIKKIPTKSVAKYLPNLKALTHRSDVCLGLDPMLSIQSRCGFYNYDIAQLTTIRSSSDSTNNPKLLSKIDTINKTTQENNQQLKLMADQPNVQMNFHEAVGNAVGNNSFSNNSFGNNAFCNVEGDMNINTSPSSKEEATKAITDLLSTLRQKNPDATDAEIIDIMTQAFENMPQNNPQKWQKWQNILGILFTGVTEGTKVVMPITAIPIEVTKQLYRIYRASR